MDSHTGSTIALTAGGVILILAGIALWRLDPALDLLLFDALRPSVPGTWIGLVTAFTRLGGFAMLGPAALAVAGWLLLRKRTAEALWLFLTIATGRLAVEGLKLLTERPRPPLPGRLDLVTTYSFPSSHSAGTMLTLLALATLAGRPGLVPLAIALASAMGWSRIALGVHWPGDVLAGWGLGMLWVGIAAIWLPARNPHP